MPGLKFLIENYTQPQQVRLRADYRVLPITQRSRGKTRVVGDEYTRYYAFQRCHWKRMQVILVNHRQF